MSFTRTDHLRYEAMSISTGLSKIRSVVLLVKKKGRLDIGREEAPGSMCHSVSSLLFLSSSTEERWQAQCMIRASESQTLDTKASSSR